jgi:hypothetical protein
MKINDRKIREDLKQFSVPEYEPDKMKETIYLARKAYRERLLSKRIGFWEFITMQVRFIGRWVWLAQAALLMGFLFLLNRSHFGRLDMQPVLLLLSLIAPLIAFVGFPEILKSYAHGMEEIEACTRFSMRKLMGARMLILGLADLCSLTIILAASAAGNASLILRMILYLFVPFNMTCCACLTVLDHVKSRYDGYYCGVVCVAFVMFFSKLSLVKKYYEAAATGAWIVFFYISIAYLAIEIVRIFQSFNQVCFNDETFSAKWQ